MKTLRLLLFSLLIAGTASAQFFQRVYGTPNTRDVLESGVNYDFPGAPIAQKGYVMCGYTNFNSANFLSPMVTRTMLNGNVFFNNNYPLNFFGRPVEASARRVITYNNGQIGVIGDWTYQPGSPHTMVFYMLLAPAGGVVNVWTYAFPNVASIEATSLTPSVAPAPQQNVYACGNITDAAGARHPFALSVQAFNGAAINWIWDYRDVANNAFEWTVEDLIESPYPNPNTGTVDIALVGRYVLAAGGMGLGNLFTLDAATGLVSSFIHEYGFFNNDAGFNAIIIANNPNGPGPGYAIAGYTLSGTAAPITYDMWALKVSPNAAVQWSSRMDYSFGGRNDFGFDILERFSPTLLQYEYYVGGYVDQGIFGNEDEVVYKLDFMGNPFPAPNQFSYGGPGWERILQMDYYQNGVGANNVGLSAFNWTINSFPLLGATDFYHVKSYFNGVTPLGAAGGGVGNCNHNQQWMNWMPGPPLVDSTKGDTVFKAKQDFLQWQIFPMQQAIICIQNNPIAGGSNARLAHSGDFGVSSSSLYPNPVSISNPLVNLTFDVPGVNDAVDIELYNTLGQLVMHKQQTLGDGETEMPVNLGTGLSAGVYSLVIRREGEVITHKISVQ